MIFNFGSSVYKGVCIKRPSSIIKSPYVADVQLLPDNETLYLAHSPALSLGNIIKPGTELLLTKSSNPKSKTQYNIKAAYDNGVYVGATPLDANRLFKWGFQNKLLNSSVNFEGILKSEVKYGESRIDFSVTHEDNVEYYEVKCVPIKHNKGHAYFPEGYRKSKKHTVSERANKHINELSQLQKNGNIVFIVLRDDVECFKPNDEDEEFCRCLNNAVKSGVKIHVYCVGVSEEGYTWKGELPYYLPVDPNPPSPRVDDCKSST